MGSETFKVDIFIQTYLKLPIKLIHSEVLIRNHKNVKKKYIKWYKK